MNEELVKNVYETIVNEGITTYKDLYENTKVSNQINHPVSKDFYMA